MKRAALFLILGFLALLVIHSFFRFFDLPEERRAKAVAIREAKTKGWTFVRVTDVERSSNKWTIYIQRFPPELGGHASVEVVDGKVVKYHPGK
jgi:hypothetical protein